MLNNSGMIVSTKNRKSKFCKIMTFLKQNSIVLKVLFICDLSTQHV